MTIPCCAWRYALAVLLLVLRVPALVQNRTIDDSLGDQVTGVLPVYTPNASVWNVGQQCTECFAQPDARQAFDHTWHDTTVHSDDLHKVTVTFNGTAVYAYCIIPNTIPSADSLTNLSFILDGNEVGIYQYVPNTSTDFNYNVNVYANNSLNNEEHTFVIQPMANPNASILLFDYIEYTFDSDPAPTATATAETSPAVNNTSRPNANVGAIAGGAVAGGMTLTIPSIFIFLLLRRRRMRNVDTIQSRPVDAGDGPFLEDRSGSTTASEMSIRRGHHPYLLSQTENTSSLGLRTNVPFDRYHDRSADFASGSQYGNVIGTCGAPAETPNGFELRQDPSPSPETFSQPHPASIAPPLPAAASLTSDFRAAPAVASRRSGGPAEASPRREELDARVHDMEAQMANLQSRRYSTRTRTNSQSFSLQTRRRLETDEGDRAMVAQIEELKEEVQRLRTQQRQMLWEMSDQPPPEYHAPA